MDFKLGGKMKHRNRQKILFAFIFLFGIAFFGCDLFIAEKTDEDYKDPTSGEKTVRGCKYIFIRYYYYYNDDYHWFYDPIEEYYCSAIQYTLCIPFDEALSILTNNYGESNYTVSGLRHKNSDYSYTILEEIPFGDGFILTLHRRVEGKENIAKGWILEE